MLKKYRNKLCVSMQGNMNKRPNFKDIKSYAEFSKYYWYKEELKQICKNLYIDFSGTKLELNYNLEGYFKGNIITKKKQYVKLVIADGKLTLDTKLVECGFCFNQKFRNFLREQSGISNFKFTADMAATVKKVKKNHDTSFTLRDLLDVYYGKKEYAKYDNSSCGWNQFIKDFCADKTNSLYSNQLKVASILWREVRNSIGKKIYTKELRDKYRNKLKDYELEQ